MITVTRVGSKPEYTPETKFGSFFDGTNFFYFESDQERIDYMAALPQPEIVQPLKIDVSDHDIDSLTEEQIDKLIDRMIEKLKTLLNK